MDTGNKVSITAFGMDRITGPVSKLDTKVSADLFPGYDVDSLQRRTDKVDNLFSLAVTTLDCLPRVRRQSVEKI